MRKPIIAHADEMLLAHALAYAALLGSLAVAATIAAHLM